MEPLEIVVPKDERNQTVYAIIDKLNEVIELSLKIRKDTDEIIKVLAGIENLSKEEKK